MTENLYYYIIFKGIWIHVSVTDQGSSRSCYEEEGCVNDGWKVATSAKQLWLNIVIFTYQYDIINTFYLLSLHFHNRWQVLSALVVDNYIHQEALSCKYFISMA